MAITNFGLYPTSIIFQLPTGITDDFEGGSADGLTAVTVPCRVKVATQNRASQFNTAAFEGTNNNSVMLLGWCGTEAAPTEYLFPNNLRGWPELPTGTMELNGTSGKVEVLIQPFAIADAAPDIGERFIARWTAS